MVKQGFIPGYVVMPLPEYPPRLTEDFRPCCVDCQSADTIVRLRLVASFELARAAVGRDRATQLASPGRLHGYVRVGLVRGCRPGDPEQHCRWLAGREELSPTRKVVCYQEVEETQHGVPDRGTPVDRGP